MNLQSRRSMRTLRIRPRLLVTAALVTSAALLAPALVTHGQQPTEPAGSPAVAAFLGGTMADAAEVTENMTDICHGTSSRFKLPTLDMRGTPVGVDARLVAKLGQTPKVNTGILHVSDGSGQVGAGVATAPLGCFSEAVLDLARRLS